MSASTPARCSWSWSIWKETRSRIGSTRDPLPIEQALTIATGIADALPAAHRQGIVNRDFKLAT
jgi:hypothetical protein